MGGPSTSGSGCFRNPSSVTHQPTQGQPRIVGTDGDPGLPDFRLRGRSAGAAPCSTIRSPHDSALDRAKRVHDTAGFRGGDKCVLLRKVRFFALRCHPRSSPAKARSESSTPVLVMDSGFARGDRATGMTTRERRQAPTLPTPSARSSRLPPSRTFFRTRRHAAGISCRSPAPPRCARPARVSARGGCARRRSPASRWPCRTDRARRG